MPKIIDCVRFSDNVVDTHMSAGETYTINDLWHAALVGSSNKAILTLVHALGFEQGAFVEAMNRKAQELGMVDSLFVDPTGLDEGNLSTASDVALLLKEALKKQAINQALLVPEYTLIETEGEQHHFWNTDWLLLGWIPHTFSVVHGGKTGYIPLSGYNVAVEVSNDAGHALLVVIIGAENNEARFTEARDIAEWVYENFVWPM